jgi:hypothetical protein
MLALVLLGLAWRTTRYLLGFPLWGDESFVAVNLYLRDFAGMVRPLEYVMIVPLGFMWAELGVVRALGTSELALHLVPYLCGAAALVVFWRFCRAALPRRAALLAVGFLAAAYYPVRHAAEVKPYAGDLLVALVLVCLAWAVLRRPRSVWRWVGLSAFAALSVWLSYPAVFVGGGAAAALAWAVLRRRRSAGLLAGLVGYGAALGGSFVAMWLTYGRAHSQAAAAYREINTWVNAFPPLEKPWLIPWWWIKIHTGNMLAYPVGGKNFGSAVTFLLVVAGAVSLWRRRRGEMLLLLLAPLVLMFVAAALKLYPYGTSARVSLHMAPAFCILAGAGLAALIERFFRGVRLARATFIAAAVLGGIAVAGLAVDAARPYKRLSDLRRKQAVEAAARMNRPGDRWLIFMSLEPDNPHAPHYAPFKGSAAAFRCYVYRYLPAEQVLWAPPPRSVSPEPPGRVFLLAYHDNKYPFPKEQFERYVAALSRRLGAAKRVRRDALDPDEPDGEAVELYQFAGGEL